MEQRLKDAAILLAAARRDGKAVALVEGWPPASRADAEDLLDLALQAMGEPIIGYKIGATSANAQALLGLDAPFFGAMPASALVGNEKAMDLPNGVLGAECEFAFRIGEDQVPGKRYDAQSIAALVESCHPAIEIVGRRALGDGMPPALEAVADFALNVSFVHGAPIADWRERDLAEIEVEGRVNGEMTNQGSGALVMGGPLKALAWLANQLADRGDGLKAGHWVSTGTCLGVIQIGAGDRVSGHFDGVGSVTISLNG